MVHHSYILPAISPLNPGSHKIKKIWKKEIWELEKWKLPSSQCSPQLQWASLGDFFGYLNIFKSIFEFFDHLWKYSVTLNIRLSLGRVFRGLAMANFNYCGKNLNLISSEFHNMWNFEFQIWKKPLGRLFSRAYVWAVFPEAMIFAKSARFAWILWNSPGIKYFIHQQK